MSENARRLPTAILFVGAAWWGALVYLPQLLCARWAMECPSSASEGRRRARSCCGARHRLSEVANGLKLRHNNEP